MMAVDMECRMVVMYFGDKGDRTADGVDMESERKRGITNEPRSSLA